MGNDKDGYTYISKNGTQQSNLSTLYGANGASDQTIRHFDSVTDAVNFAQQQKQGPYTNAYTHAETAKQDAANIAAATTASKTDYNVLGSNCGQTVAAGEKAAGTPGYTGPDPNPKAAMDYEGSKAGQKAGWQPFNPAPTPPPPPPDKKINN